MSHVDRPLDRMPGRKAPAGFDELAARSAAEHLGGPRARRGGAKKKAAAVGRELAAPGRSPGEATEIADGALIAVRLDEAAHAGEGVGGGRKVGALGHRYADAGDRQSSHQ